MVEIPQITSIADRMFEAAASQGKERFYLGMSQIGEPCTRKLWLSFRGFSPDPIEGRGKMIFSLGDRVEEEVIKWLGMAGYVVTERQKGFSDHKGFFRGHWDGRIDGVTKKPHVLEVKSANDKRFKAFKEAGVKEVSPAYFAQMQAYMGYSGLERALFLVMNKDNCELYTERLYFDKEAFEKIKQKAWRIITTDELPESSIDRESQTCFYCEYKGHCKSSPYIQNKQTCTVCTHCTFADGIPKCKLHKVQLKNWKAHCPQWEFKNLSN